MASLKCGVRLSVIFLLFLYKETGAKLPEKEAGSAGPESTEPEPTPEVRTTKKFQMNEGSSGAAMLFSDELKQTLERYLFGICPQTFKSRWSQMQLSRSKNTTYTCDLDTEQQDLAGRFATLALRVHSAGRSDCARLGAALANTFGELARTAANRHAVNVANSEAAKKRKLSKSQKAKIQAKQRTALAVKKKAAAMAAAAAAKITTV